MNGEKGILFTQGNEACVRGALYAGLRFFAGYPITPSTEVAELLSEECRMWAAGSFRWRTRFPHYAPCARRRWLGTRP